MKFCSTLLSVAALLAASSTGAAFAPSPSFARQQHSLLTRASTTEKTTELIPPQSLDQIMADEGATAAMYDQNVQKTYGRYPLTMKYGKGCKLYTTDGKEYLDCVSGIATCALGHSNEALTQAVTDQMKAVHHVSNLYLIPAQAALANWLCTNSIGAKAFFCNSGAEANEAAIKLARRHASNRGITKPIIITAHQSFHGRTLAALTATAQPKYHKGFGYGGEMVPGFKYVPYNDAAALEAAVKEIQAMGDGAGLAAIMMEALQGEGGIIPGDKEFFKTVRRLCDETDAVMICDEVQVGMGRSGKLWGYQNTGVEPDVFTSAKALGGGVPIGAMIANAKVADVFGPGDHASTYGGNPLACAAGLAVAKYFSDHNVLANVQARGEQLNAGLAEISKKYPQVLGSVRGWGLLNGVEITDAAIPAGQVVQAAMDQGLLLVAAGPNVVRFVPPLIITEAEMKDALTMFEKAVAKVAADVGKIAP